MPTLEDGQLFGRYLIMRGLGSGSSGECYEAEDSILLRKVTLKLIHPWANLPDAARRQFFREMQGISALNYPSLAPVLDYGEVTGRMYVARRYVGSGSLLGVDGRVWFRPPLPVADACNYLYQLAQTLQYIHRNGYIHGALTFTNLLVLHGPGGLRTDFPFLMADIGLATFVRRFGQPPSMALPVSAAPEQQNKRVTAASDQFSLAVLFYFWLAGRFPYLGTPEEVEQSKVAETVTPLSQVNPGCTPQQDVIVRRALAASPENRYPSVLAFAEALQAALPVAPPPTASFSAFREPPETPRVSPPISPEKTISAPARQEERTSFLEQLLAPQLPVQNSYARFEEVTDVLEQEPAPFLFSPLPETPRPEADPSREDLVRFTNEADPAFPPVPSTGMRGTAEPSVPVSEAAPGRAKDQTNAEEQPAPVSRTPIEQAAMPSADVDLPAPAAPPTEEELVYPVPRLIISSPYVSGTYEFPLLAREINVGRAGASDLHLERDNLTSRHHALLKREGEHTLLFDKQSYNGVFLNGQRIEVACGYELVDGDRIGIGNYELIFRSTLDHN